MKKEIYYSQKSLYVDYFLHSFCIICATENFPETHRNPRSDGHRSGVFTPAFRNSEINRACDLATPNCKPMSFISFSRNFSIRTVDLNCWNYFYYYTPPIFPIVTIFRLFFHSTIANHRCCSNKLRDEGIMFDCDSRSRHPIHCQRDSRTCV